MRWKEIGKNTNIDQILVQNDCKVEFWINYDTFDLTM